MIKVGQRIVHEGKFYTIKRITHSAIPGDVELVHLDGSNGSKLKIPMEILKQNLNKRKVMRELAKVWRFM